MSKKPLVVIAISGSLSAQSKTATLTDHVIGQLQEDRVNAQHFRLSELPVGCLHTQAAGKVPELLALEERVAAAHGVIVATPIYKSSYSGLLKSFLDLLPQFALAGKVVLPIATGGSLAHVLAVDYALRPVLQSMGARHVVQGHFVLEGSCSRLGADPAPMMESEAPLYEAVKHFEHCLSDDPRMSLFGHPRPHQAV